MLSVLVSVLTTQLHGTPWFRSLLRSDIIVFFQFTAQHSVIEFGKPLLATSMAQEEERTFELREAVAELAVTLLELWHQMTVGHWGTGRDVDFSEWPRTAAVICQK